MRAIWKGAISFGLVNIPIALYTATRKEDLKFHLLRKTDLSPVNYKRVAAADGKEVAWEHIVKGYEYEKGKYIVLKDEDFARVDVEATQTVDIVDFVQLEEVSPIFFYKPYYMEPEKGGDKAYVLLREALRSTSKIGIAKVVIKTRQYLAAVRPQEHGLILELMHFSDELVNPSEFKIPKSREVGKKELAMAESLIASMSGPWEPEKYHDEYREALKEVIEEKIEHPHAALPQPAAGRKKPTNVVDLVAVLQASLNEGSGRKSEGGAKPPKKAQKPSSTKKAKSAERKSTRAPTRKAA
jgi:DNA end-binding protein Ku